MSGLELLSPAEPSTALETFRETYQAHFAYVWRVLARLGVPERDLADATQDVFVVVYRKQDSFDSTSRITTWLYGICFRVASDRRRSAKSRYEVLEEPPERGANDAGDEQAVRSTHYRRLLSEALDAMPLEQRAVFAFYELDGLSGDEIAERVGVAVPTVHSRLRLAREVFRRFVGRVERRESFEDERSGGGR